MSTTTRAKSGLPLGTIVYSSAQKVAFPGSAHFHYLRKLSFAECFDTLCSQDRLLLSYPERVGKNLDVKAVQPGSGDKNELVFDLVGIDASIANALRRILLAEVMCRKHETNF